MYIKKEQIKALEALINEGFFCQSHALEGKKQYLKKAQEWLGNRYRESKIEVPAWVYTLNSETANLKPKSVVRLNLSLF